MSRTRIHLICKLAVGCILSASLVCLAEETDQTAIPNAIEVGPPNPAKEEAPQESVSPIFTPKQKFIFGLDLSNFYYQEEMAPPGKSTERARLLSPFLRYEFPMSFSNISMISMEGKTSGFSTTDYDGTTLSTNTPVTGKNPALFAQGEIDLHFELIESELYFFTGLGFHYWNRYLSGGSGYREIYSWLYLPLGLRFEQELNELWKLQAELSYQVMFAGKLLVITSETNPGGDDSSLDLASRPGLRARAALERSLSPQFSLSAQLWFEASKIGQSNEVFNASFAGLIHEPSSQTTQSGLSLAAIYKF